jgi:transcriptional regulator with XRE-family HTH domain
MEDSRTVREARQSAGLSQRAVAARAGIATRTVAGIESGEHRPSLRVLDAVLAACGLELTTQPQTRAASPCRHLVEHLRRSLSQRWGAAAAATGRAGELEEALATAAVLGDLVLEPSAGVPLWVPGAALALPVVVTAHQRLPGDGRRPPGVAADPALVVARVERRPLPAGLVRVRVVGLLDVHAPHPSTLVRDPCCRTWRPALAAAAAAVDDRGTDNGGRRPPAHRQPDEDGESWRLSHALRYVGGPRPRAQDSRALRLDAPVSLPQWLAENGLPPLRGQRERW